MSMNTTKNFFPLKKRGSDRFHFNLFRLPYLLDQDKICYRCLVGMLFTMYACMVEPNGHVYETVGDDNYGQMIIPQHYWGITSYLYSAHLHQTDVHNGLQVWISFLAGSPICQTFMEYPKNYSCIRSMTNNVQSVLLIWIVDIFSHCVKIAV